MDAVIEVEALTHRYGERTALQNLSFSVARGEVFGLLGPNGAGKTTTVRLLNGLFQPASGAMRVLGLDPLTQGEAIRRQTGVLTETPALYERLTARQNLDFFGTLAGMNRAELAARSKELFGFFELEERADDRVGTFSKGMKQRLALARALLHHPALLFLDEPTSGLDPEAALQVRELIDSIRARDGHTVVLATHHLEEAEKLCDRVAILNQGRLTALGSLTELRRRISAGISVQIELQQPLSTGAIAELRAIHGMRSLQVADCALELVVEEQAVIPQAARVIVQAGGLLLRLQPHEASLEDVYFAMQNGQQAGGV